MHLCRYLRWKSYYGADFVTKSDALQSAARNEVPFHCLKTCRSWGPDDDASAPELCTPQRACFQASPRFADDRLT